MKFFAIHTVDERLLQSVYAKRPDLLDAPYSELEQLHEEFNPMLQWGRETPDWNAKQVIANDLVAQSCWLREKKSTIKDAEHWMQRIVRKQVDKFEPDILLIGDPLTFDVRFVGALKKRPRWVVAWHDTVLQKSSRWKDMDMLLSSSPLCIEKAMQKGIKRAHLFQPGFPRWAAEVVMDEPNQYDVVCCGTWTESNEQNCKLIKKLAQASLHGSSPFRLGLFLDHESSAELPDVVRQLNQGPRWGMDLYRALKSGHLAVIAPNEAITDASVPSLLLEVTGLGACALVPKRERLSALFTDGQEMIAYSGGDELLVKIASLLESPALRMSVARKGQERCLTTYGMERSMNELSSLLVEQKPESLVASLMKRLGVGR